jgi:Domain of unknown function (DUF3842)
VIAGAQKKRIGVIDGQGGGIGSNIIKQLKSVYAEQVEIIALGTNAIATSQMLKARANRGASGENAIVQTTAGLDVIIGPVGIVMAHAMMGEVTPKMAEAVALSPARKLLIPLTRENVEIVGTSSLPLPRLIETMIQENLPQLLGDLVEHNSGPA